MRFGQVGVDEEDLTNEESNEEDIKGCHHNSIHHQGRDFHTNSKLFYINKFVIYN